MSAVVDLSDPQIIMAYDALLHNDPLRWVVLAYGNKPNELRVCASGIGDVDELRSYIKPNDICYGVFREPAQDCFLRLALSYIPDSVRGVWRARALVHGKAVYTKFTAHECLNISSPDQLSVQAVRSILRLPPRMIQNAPPQLPQAEGTNVQLELSLPSDIPRTASRPHIVHRKPIPDMFSFSISEKKRSPSPEPWHEPGPSIISPLNHQLSNSEHPLSAIKNRTATIDELTVTPHSPLPLEIITSGAGFPYMLPELSPSPNDDAYEGAVFATTNRPETATPLSDPSWLAKQNSPLPPRPPVTPSDDESQNSLTKSIDSIDRPGSPQIPSIPDTKSTASSVLAHYQPAQMSSTKPSPPPSTSVPSKGSFISTIDDVSVTSLPSPPSSPKYADVKPVPPVDEKGSYSIPKNSRSKFHVRVVSAAEAEEERKLAVLEEERRWRAAERAKVEKEEREEEEAREREFAERKEREKIRKLESAKRAEERRAEMRRQQDEEESRRKAEKDKKEIEIQRRKNQVQKRIEKHTGMDLLSGFITLESGTSWKRRYYRLSTEQWIFYKNDEDTVVPMHILDLCHVQALREWHEGYEELEAIPNSFALEIQDDKSWLFFADSSEDKEILLVLLNQAAGL